MIKRIKIRGFKSLREIDLVLGDLNLFIGTNASGKSNFFDALRVLQGIGYGFSIEEILNGKPKGAASDVWESLRGGSAKASFAGRESESAGDDGLIGFGADLTVREKSRKSIHYEVQLSPTLRCVRGERLAIDGVEMFSSAEIENTVESAVLRVRYYHGKKGRQPHLDFEKSRPVLSQLGKRGDCLREHKELAEVVLRSLSNMQRIDPSPSELRKYSGAALVKRMGERGENFAALVRAIAQDETAKSAYVSWLKQLTPTEVEDVTILQGALGEPLFAIRESGRDLPAPILSDGTLRFAAISAAFFQPDMPDVLTIEEIENGIHPSRLRLLVEILRSQSARENRQVMATSHSPIVLTWLRPEDYRTTFFCKRDEETGESLIRPLTDVPDFLEAVKRHPIDELFAEGWLEGAL